MNQIADQGKDPKTDRKENLEAQPRAKAFEIHDTRLHGSRCACSLPVCAVLYLIFNEGYASSSGTELQRVDLSSEAIRLTRLLMTATPDMPEVAGLLALMLLTDARRAARSGPAGELIPLDEQDRGCWDRDLIHEGIELVWNAMKQVAWVRTNYKPPSRRFTTRPHRRSKPTGLRSMRFTDCWSEWATIRWSR